MHGTVEVLQCELLFGVTRARSARLSRILAGSAIDAAQHDPLVFSVLVVGDQPLGKGLVQESKPLHAHGASVAPRTNELRPLGGVNCGSHSVR